VWTLTARVAGAAAPTGHNAVAVTAESPSPKAKVRIAAHHTGGDRIPRVMTDLRPTAADKFTFGLWTVGNRGRDPFGEATRPALDPIDAVRHLSGLGAWGVNFHDNDLVPIDAAAAERDRILRDFKQALDDHGMAVPMATTNLFTDPVFRDGAFTSLDPAVRGYALQKTMRAMDLGAELGAQTYVFWGGREGAEVDAAKDPVEAIKRFRDAIDFLCEYNLDQGYGLRFALEAKPNEPRGDIYFPTTASYLAFIGTLAHPEIVGVNPEVAHEHMIGLNFYHVVAQAIEAGKLFHIDLNDQKPGRFDQDLRFGAESIKALFFVVKLLEESGYEGPRHFDAHALRTETPDGVWEFARGCMRTYLLLKEKARRFADDREIQDLLAEIRHQDPVDAALLQPYSPAAATALRTREFDRARLAARPLHHERLDQCVVELLLGNR
jgi:xylose isomerase